MTQIKGKFKNKTSTKILSTQEMEFINKLDGKADNYLPLFKTYLSLDEKSKELVADLINLLATY